MGIEEIKDLVYDLYCEVENEITDFNYKGRELSQEEIIVSLDILKQFMNKLYDKLDDKIEDTKNNIRSLENFINDCCYGKRELYELQNLNERLEILESRYEEYE